VEQVWWGGIIVWIKMMMSTSLPASGVDVFALGHNRNALLSRLSITPTTTHPLHPPPSRRRVRRLLILSPCSPPRKKGIVSRTSTMGATEAGEDAILIKAAKRVLKREGSTSDGSMKMKDLTKSLLEDGKLMDASSHDKRSVRRCIENCDTFEIDGKMVALKKKKKSKKKGKGGGGGDDDDNDDGDDDDDEKKKEKKRKSSSAEEGAENGDKTTTTEEWKKAERKAAKRAKRDKTQTTTTSGETKTTTTSSSSNDVVVVVDESAIQRWRTEHKIVLRDSRSGEEGASMTKIISSNVEYHPYRTFDDVGCKTMIHDRLIRQCTVINKFARPSPIQSQCWPVLLSRDEKTGRYRDAVGIAETGSGKLAQSSPFDVAFALGSLSSRRFDSLMAIVVNHHVIVLFILVAPQNINRKDARIFHARPIPNVEGRDVACEKQGRSYAANAGTCAHARARDAIPQGHRGIRKRR
jgi:hypothetical protein